jgi:hypothetical protein
MKVVVKRLKNEVSEECSKEGQQQHDEFGVKVTSRSGVGDLLN